jgi:hypothetical protein
VAACLEHGKRSILTYYMNSKIWSKDWSWIKRKFKQKKQMRKAHERHLGTIEDFHVLFVLNRAYGFILLFCLLPDSGNTPSPYR